MHLHPEKYKNGFTSDFVHSTVPWPERSVTNSRMQYSFGGHNEREVHCADPSVALCLNA